MAGEALGVWRQRQRMTLATRVFFLTLLAALPIFAILVAQEAQLRSSCRAEII